MLNIDQILNESAAGIVSTARDMAKIPTPMGSEVVAAAIEDAARSAHEKVEMAQKEDKAAGQHEQTMLTWSLAATEVSNPNDYLVGASPLLQPSNQAANSDTPATMIKHVGRMQSNATQIAGMAKAFPLHITLAVLTALVLMVIGALGVLYPLMIQQMGADGDASQFAWIVWSVLISTALALTCGAINVTFFRATIARMAPWATALIVVALFFLVARYIASAIAADFLLIEELPVWAKTTLRLLKASGEGIALVLIEMGAGRALAFAWIRMQQIGDKAQVSDLLSSIAKWEAATVQANAVQYSVISINDMKKSIALKVVQSVDSELDVHRKDIHESELQADFPSVGSRLDLIDVKWLRHTVEACESACQDLLIRCGVKQPPTGWTSATTSDNSNPPKTPSPSSVI